MADNILLTDNLTVGYGSKKIVTGVNLSIKPGEIIALIGPNGAGKSTILRTVAGQLEPLSGSVFINDISIEKVPTDELAKEIAVLFTSDVIREKITCFEVVAMGRYPYTGFLGRLSKSDVSIVHEAMEMTLAIDLKDNDFTKLSDGQRQRVLLARALCQEPRLLILDEPTTFLDVKYRLEFLGLLKRLSREKGFGVVLSLHELDMARQLADKIICVKNGEIVRAGTPEEIFEKGFINELFDITVGNYDERSYRAML